jgi:hypothetical protein
MQFIQHEDDISECDDCEVPTTDNAQGGAKIICEDEIAEARSIAS